ncbi:class I SAM-dependent methyltransferase [Morganella morganii]|uniref:Putative SAM-dependent methyltransferase n=1 Tax=Morganella morganii subsp. morganii KT TaxID=1124991 RepID=M1RIX9_MORMO|nr:class I SAM-dependent methyltransferase [Morganella morganii]AGG30275.1 Putative SAM-dependent methyltransferase [Morganella morganii subsp. morganii KT]AZP26617.1 class I SAM-dependent methyltransferase [Morganella morganii]EJK8625500.1 class I SAM-dependent methyltransferase [Morganella morganii]EKU4285992.1 class I SAM-dependent methyltransferase [Morganella morganii]EKU4301969.1 class I SAM-dependent methyltransferase [Morganella morganii]
MSLNTNDGSKVYTPLSLSLYDWWVLKISNNYAWHCNTDKFLIPHFKFHLGNNHMDIGVGTGFYLKKSADKINKITLSDLNVHSLECAKKYISDEKLNSCLCHDIFNRFTDELRGGFDSVSIFYLLHCLPGKVSDKKQAIINITETLKDDGILYGATILGEGVKHNRFGSKLMSVYNKKGIFSNVYDSADSLETMLSSLFEDVSVNIQGTVALFTAKNKK